MSSTTTEITRQQMLKSMQEQITQTIKDLQDIEKGMADNLTAVQSGADVNATEKNAIITRINNLSNQRTALFNELSNMYQRSQLNLKEDRVDLADQLTMVKMVEGELNRTKENYNALNQAKENKLRLVQIGNSESARYKAHIQLMKVISFCIFLIILVSIIGQYALLSSAIVSTLIIIILVFMSLYTIRHVIDIYSRNNMDFTKYNVDFPFPEDNANGVINPHDSTINTDNIPGSCAVSSSTETFSNYTPNYDWRIFGFGDIQNSVTLPSDMNSIKPVETSSLDEYFSPY